MSEGHNSLLIDAGNSNVKYCLFDEKGTLTPLPNADFQSSEHFSKYAIDKVVLCSVRDKAFAESLSALCKSNAVCFQQVFTQAESFGTKCAYQNFQTLGVDRWMNILAVARETEQAVLTFSIGTAMTIDLVYNRQHLGGWITPGFDLSKNALFNNTNGVFGNLEYPARDKFGESTEDCVNFGCKALVNGLLREALAQAKAYSKEPKIKVFGGGIGLLNTNVFDNLEVDELLVFKGLARFI